MILWAFGANGIYGLQSRIDMKQEPDESQLHIILKERIVEPGGHVCNPPLTPAGVFPPGEPVFSIRYAGIGHESAGRLFFLRLAIVWGASLLAAWMLSHASRWILSRYFRRVLFFAGIGAGDIYFRGCRAE